MWKTVSTAFVLIGVFTVTACSSEQSAVSEQAFAELKQQVEEQQAIEEIRNLFAAYGRTLDERNYAAFAELYADDAVYAGGGGAEAVGPKAIADQLESVIGANASGANLHFYSNEMIDVDMDSGTATARSRGAFYVEDENGNPLPLMFATYEDTLVHTTEGWKFQRREVIGDLPGRANEERFTIQSAE